MCVWLPLLDNIAIDLRGWTLVRRLDNFLGSETDVEDLPWRDTEVLAPRSSVAAMPNITLNDIVIRLKD